MIHLAVTTAAIILVCGGLKESDMERESRIVTDAKDRVKSEFDLSKMKYEIRKIEKRYEVEFYPAAPLEIGNGVVCYYTLGGVFIEKRYTQ